MNKRPTSRSLEVLEPAMTSLYENSLLKSQNWNNMNGMMSREETVDALVNNFSYDAYDFAKGLDRDYFEITYDIVELLDGAAFYVRKELDNANLKFVQDNNLIAEFKVGDRVLLGKEERIVTEVRETTGKYVLASVEQYVPGKIIGRIVEFEDVKAIG